MRRERVAPAAIAAAALLAAPAGAAAAPPPSVRFDGAAAGDLAGSAVARAGDVNSDGHDDLLAGARWAGHEDRPRAGSAYVFLSP
jgi:hypothetical protein